MKKKYISLVAIAFSVIILDQITKCYVDANMSLHETLPVIEGFFNITYIRNPGAAFGFLAGAYPLFRVIFFIAVSLFAVILILIFIARTKKEESFLIFSLSLILGGALGNLIDRIRFGEVIDFLDVYVSGYHWPAFNVADSAISVGAVLLVMVMCKKKDGRIESSS